MTTREPYLRKLFLAFVLASISFIAIFLLAYSVSYLNYTSIKGDTNIISSYIAELNHSAQNSSCDNRLLFVASNKLDFVGTKISFIENHFGKTDPRVIAEKKLYSDLELAHLAIIKKRDKLCNSNFTIILFFYSNQGASADQSETTGYILDTFKREHSKRVMVYSFDTNLNDSSVIALKRQYHVISAPVVVVNSGAPFFLRNINQLARYISKRNH